MTIRPSLYTVYRPNCWNDLVEQDAIKQILSEELKTGNLKHCLMFTGGAGTGKTTSARIYANEIESVSSNIIELNCAKENGVKDIKPLIDGAKSRPLTGNYKIFILDECHCLTKEAQSSLLKILEEPPTYCIFILCTTDPQKILPPVMSRSFRYDFQLISHNGITNRLNYILQCEKDLGTQGSGVISWQSEALDYIAQLSQGHMRDAIVLLEKAITYSKHLTKEDIVKVIGAVEYDNLFDILDSIINKDSIKLIYVIDQIEKSGMDLKLFIKNFLSFIIQINRFVILKSNNVDYKDFISIPSCYHYRLVYNISHKDQLRNLLSNILNLNSTIRWETDVRTVLESNLLLEAL